VQHIKLGERLTSFSGDSAQEWLNSIERRAQQLQGKTKRSNQEVTVTIPFNNGAELEAKFNASTQLIRKTLRLLQIQQMNCQILAHMSLAQNNLLLLLESVEL